METVKTTVTTPTIIPVGSCFYFRCKKSVITVTIKFNTTKTDTAIISQAYHGTSAIEKAYYYFYLMIIGGSYYHNGIVLITPGFLPDRAIIYLIGFSFRGKIDSLWLWNLF